MDSPRNQVGLVSATSLVIANMIGSGLFVTSGFALRDLGHPNRVVLAWAIGGVIAMCGALSYGALVRHMTESGGEYLFLARTVHPFAGFLAGWVSLLSAFTGAIAFAATTLETYIWPAAGGWVAVGVVFLTGGPHLIGLRFGAGGQNLVVAIKLCVVIVFAILGAAALPQHPPRVDLPAQPFSISKLAMSLVWISLSYSGFNAAVYIASEVKDAEATVPRALWIGTLLVTFLYVGLNAIFVWTPPASAIAGSEDVAAVSAAILGGSVGATAVRIAISLALLSSVSSMLMAAPRVYAKMASDGVFPQLFSLQAGQVPRAAIWLQMILAAALCLTTTLQGLLDYLGFTLSLSAAATVACIFVLRRRKGAANVPVVGGLVAPGIYVLATLTLATLAASLSPLKLLGPIATVVSGWIAYLLLARRL